ncbi:MAG: class I SAM-dependent methyltransferase [Pelolinea sp.]|nr:class I SAM-dependent methyltransferase [Pelolinea sp.]
MKPETIAKLHRINQEFYQTFSRSFASTRRRIQPGIRKVLQEIPGQGNWLDIGCGSGALAAEWMRQERRGMYYGIDFSPNLIAEAKNEILEVQKPKNLEVKFTTADLMSDGWHIPFERINWDGALSFAVLHHIPGEEQRQKLCATIAGLLGKDKKLYLSVWQVENSPRLMLRIQPWDLVGINESELDAGDVLMDWRAENKAEQQSGGLRYVHVFKEDELSALAAGSGFRVMECFYSDGKEGSLGLYQVWEAEN